MTDTFDASGDHDRGDGVATDGGGALVETTQEEEDQLDVTRVREVAHTAGVDAELVSGHFTDAGADLDVAVAARDEAVTPEDWSPVELRLTLDGDAADMWVSARVPEEGARELAEAILDRLDEDGGRE